jgi:hypothetical protein
VTTTSPQRDAAREERPQPDPLSGLIGGRVLRLLGEPAGLHAVQVRGLWQGHYRVNVLVGPDAASAKIAHSYFLVADPEGAILASTPEITRRYG